MPLLVHHVARCSASVGRRRGGDACVAVQHSRSCFEKRHSIEKETGAGQYYTLQDMYKSSHAFYVLYFTYSGPESSRKYSTVRGAEKHHEQARGRTRRRSGAEQSRAKSKPKQATHSQASTMMVIEEDRELVGDDGGGDDDDGARTDSRLLPPPILRGVVFAKSVRSRFACLHLAAVVVADEGEEEEEEEIENDDDDDDDELFDYAMLRMQFEAPDDGDNLASMRSYCRRFFKLGDLVSVVRNNCNNGDNGSVRRRNAEVLEANERRRTTDTGTTLETAIIDAIALSERRRRRVVVLPIVSIGQFKQLVEVQASRHWSHPRCQKWQRQYQLNSTTTGGNDIRNSNTGNKDTSTTRNNSDGSDDRHGRKNVKSKQEQAEYVADFLIQMIVQRRQRLELPSKQDSEGIVGGDGGISAIPSTALGDGDDCGAAIRYLNRGAGVVDAAGGAGFVSMALGMRGVRSTVVDPRESVGRLPGRLRKVWNRLLLRQGREKEQRQTQKKPADDLAKADLCSAAYCQPVQYESMRAWFGTPPDGVDADFRHDHDKHALPVLTKADDHELTRHCSAIVALHPDEATDAIVDVAVSAQIPFLIVPCCVFCRLFPHRRKPGSDDEPVSTRLELLDYLQAKHPSIQRSELPFEGANTVLWSTF